MYIKYWYGAPQNAPYYFLKDRYSVMNCIDKRGTPTPLLLLIRRNYFKEE
jgi:hypothetical protein